MEVANHTGQPSEGRAKWKDILKEGNLNIAISAISAELVNF